MNNKQKITRSVQKLFHTFSQSVWTFPVCTILLVLGLSALGISGSSVGVYDGVLNSQTAKKSNIINFQPRPIRSDEWLVTTQLIVAQYSAGYPMINENIGLGQDMSIAIDVPYKDWSTIFKPQNLIFLIAPLNFAFAFKWWSLGAILAISGYLLFLRLVPKQRFAAACFGTILFFTPMVQWWYQSITNLTLAYGFLILTLLLMLHQVDTVKRRLLIASLLAYLFAAFGLLMYPPFQVPVVLAVVAFYLAFIIHEWVKKRTDRIILRNTVAYVIGASIIALSIIGIFLIQHKSTVETIVNTAYPGKRVIDPGGYPIGNPFTGHLSTFLLSEKSSTTYKELYPVGSNQSESSNFLLPTALYLTFSVFIFIFYRKRIDSLSLYLLVGLTTICLVFYLQIYVPFGHLFYKITALNLVPHTRLLLGLGFTSALLLVVLSRVSKSKKLVFSKKQSGWFLVISTLSSLLFTYILSLRNPDYITQPVIAVVVSLLIPISLFFLIRSKLNLMLIPLVLLSIISSLYVNPLDRKLDEITDTDFAQTIRKISSSDPSARWASNSLVLENYAMANGAKSLSGVYPYPQKNIWKMIDKSGKDDLTYNRYSHVNFTFDDKQNKPDFHLISGDNYIVKISTCDNFFDKLQVSYIYGTSPIVSRCLQPIKQLTNDSGTIFIYKRVLPKDN